MEMAKIHPIHVVPQTGQKATAVVIFFHGSGAAGELMSQWVQALNKNFTFPHVKIIYPTAPLQPYQACRGEHVNVWFDRYLVSADVPEKVESINNMENAVNELIEEEKLAGIPIERIIVGGFSMGGALAFHVGYRWQKSLAGVFAISSFLNKKSIVYDELEKSHTTLPALLQIHGDADKVAKIEWGKKTYNELRQLGVVGEFYCMPKLQHTVNQRGLKILKDWIEKLVPNVPINV